TGKRLLDVFSVHYYPQSGEFGDDISTNMQLLRNRSTRSLWDPNYVDESWINNKVQLVPRLKGWVNAHYPGTKTAVTEYNWGADGNINGATTQADILGIFGREGLDIATRWTCPDSGTPTYKAFQMYRNYDGNKSTFGDSSVEAVVPDPDTMSAFAGVRSSDGVLTIMVINKDLSNSSRTAINISNFAAQSAAEVWQLTASNAITRLPDAAVSGATVNLSLPPQSVTLVVVRASGGALAPNAPSNLTATTGGETVTLNWANNSTNEAGSYVERALKKTGVFARVGQVDSNSTTYSEAVAPGKYLYRVQAFRSGLTSNYSNSVKVKVK
ncbi:MAG: glycoside hydrolase family 44 protein, partial [Blastocatellia bacterium]